MHYFLWYADVHVCLFYHALLEIKKVIDVEYDFHLYSNQKSYDS